MKKLPESFGIMRDANNPLWDKYIAWLNEQTGYYLNGQSRSNYGIQNGRYRCGSFFETILTLEQWDSIVNGWQPKQGEEIKVNK